MGHVGVTCRIIAIGGDAAVSHRVEELRDLLLDDGIGWWMRAAMTLGLLLGLLSTDRLMSLLLDDGSLLLLLCLCLGQSSLLLMHTRPETTDVAGLCR